MSRLTNIDNDLKHSITRFIREYNNEINYLKEELGKAKKNIARLEARLREKGEEDE